MNSKKKHSYLLSGGLKVEYTVSQIGMQSCTLFVEELTTAGKLRIGSNQQSWPFLHFLFRVVVCESP
jgi:hypothetical protein